MKHYKKLLIALFASIAISISFTFSDDFFEVSKNLDIFSSLFKEVNANYVDEVEPSSLMRSGINSMLKTLDPYTVYYPESDIEDVRFLTTGQYGGIGISIALRNGSFYVHEVFENSPAIAAGIRSGDIITAIENKSLNGKSQNDVNNLIRGQVNTTVNMGIKRIGENTELNKTITRKDIKIKNVPFYSMVSNDIAYIKLSGFTQEATNEVKTAFLSLKEKNNIKGLILDLRGNPGGLLLEAVNITNLFVDPGKVIVTTKGKTDESNRSYSTTKPAIDINVPIVALTNSLSASASEIVSGALQDLDRGVIIGQRSFGKGLVQNTRKLAFNTQLKLTVAKYYIPSGRCIQALDYTHRNPDGSVGKVPDSLIKAYKTRNGRTVFDGGGIAPDIQMKANTYSNITKNLLNKAFISEYASLYRNQHPNIFPAGVFSFSDNDFNNFIAFLSDKNLDYVTESEKTLERYKDEAIKENYFDAIKPEYENLMASLKRDKQQDLKKHKEEIKKVLELEITDRYYNRTGRIEVSLKNDPELQKGIEILNNPPRYQAILSEKG